MRNQLRLLFSFLTALLILLAPPFVSAATDYEKIIGYAFTNVAGSQTDATLTLTSTGQALAAVSGKKIRVLGYTLNEGATPASITFNSKGVGAGAAITSTKTFSANAGMVAPTTDYGYFQTNAGEQLTVTTGAGSTSGIDITFVYE